MRQAGAVAVFVHRNPDKSLELTVNAGAQINLAAAKLDLPPREEVLEFVEATRYSDPWQVNCGGCAVPGPLGDLVLSTKNDEVIIPGSENVVLYNKGYGVGWQIKGGQLFDISDEKKKEDYSANQYHSHDVSVHVGAGATITSAWWCGVVYLSAKVLVKVPRNSKVDQYRAPPKLAC